MRRSRKRNPERDYAFLRPRRSPGPIAGAANLVFSNVGLLLVVGLTAWIGAKWLRGQFAAGTINPASRKNIIYQAAGEPGLKLADWFKSSSEKAVDRMLATVPQATKTAQPSSGYELSPYFSSPTPPSNVLNPAGTLTSSDYRELVR